jgi:hypothetical protein
VKSSRRNVANAVRAEVAKIVTSARVARGTMIGKRAVMMSAPAIAMMSRKLAAMTSAPATATMSSVTKIVSPEVVVAEAHVVEVAVEIVIVKKAAPAFAKHSARMKMPRSWAPKSNPGRSKATRKFANPRKSS